MAVRLTNAKLWHLKFSSIPEAGHRACSDLSVKALSQDFRTTRLGTTDQGWRGKSLDMAMAKVKAVFGHHNYEVHLYNLKRLYWVNYFVPPAAPAETAVARSSRIAMRDSAGASIGELRAKWATKLESIITDCRTAMQSISTADLKGQMDRAREEAYTAGLAKELQQAKGYKPLATMPASNDLIPPARLYYRYMSAEARCDFWAPKWKLELALNIYDWAKDIVSIEANFKDQTPTIIYEDADTTYLCTICQDDVRNDTRPCTTKCEHHFHPTCLYDWLTLIASKSKCTCRVQLNRKDLEARVHIKDILHFETAKRAKHLNKYSSRVNAEAAALIKYGEIKKLPMQWAIDKLNSTGDVPKNQLLADRAKRIRVFSSKEKRSFKSGFAPATRTNTIYTSPKMAAIKMTEVQIVCENERYYMWVVLNQSSRVVGQAWLKVKIRRGLLGYHRCVLDDEALRVFCRQLVALGGKPF